MSIKKIHQDIPIRFLFLLAFLTACQPPTTATDPKADNTNNAANKTAGEKAKPTISPKPLGDNPMTMSLTSPAFADNELIPKKFTGEGEDVSPPLQWSNLPEGTKELAIICEDPDAPTAEPWVHWVIYKIPATVGGLPEGLPQTARLKNPAGALQGLNSWAAPGKPTYGYRGPMPPVGHGTHHYYFTLCALDTKLIIDPGDSKKGLIEEMQDHVLATATLTGLYSR